MASCVYCGQQFAPEDTTEEHLVLGALGGKRASRNIVCSACNNRLGAEIDRSLPEELELVRAIVGIPRNDPPTVLARGVLTGRTYRVRPGGARELLDVEAPDLSREVVETVRPLPVRIAGNPDKVRQVLKGLEKKYGPVKVCSVDQILYNEPVEPVKGSIALGVIEQSRSIMKMVVNVLAALGEEFSLSVWQESLEQARHFVATGKESVPLAVMLDSRPHLPLPPCEALSFQNRIMVVADPEAGTIVAAVEILSALKYSVVVAREYAGPRSAFLFTNRPLGRGPDTIEPVHGIRGVRADELLDRGRYDDRLAVCQFYVSRLLQMAWEYNTRRFITREVVPRAAEAAGGEALTLETLDRFAAEAARHLVLGMLPPGRCVKWRLRSEEALKREGDSGDHSCLHSEHE